MKDFFTETSAIDPEQRDAEESKLRMGFLTSNYLNFCSPDFEETLLHAAVKQNNTELITVLLMTDADPAIPYVFPFFFCFLCNRVSEVLKLKVNLIERIQCVFLFDLNGLGVKRKVLINR